MPYLEPIAGMRSGFLLRRRRLNSNEDERAFTVQDHDGDAEVFPRAGEEEGNEDNAGGVASTHTVREERNEYSARFDKVMKQVRQESKRRRMEDFPAGDSRADQESSEQENDNEVDPESKSNRVGKVFTRFLRGTSSMIDRGTNNLSTSLNRATTKSENIAEESDSVGNEREGSSEFAQCDSNKKEDDGSRGKSTFFWANAANSRFAQTRSPPAKGT
mmetsp:Transcript_16237/g.25437  ORF Transcript_16237/g.25437 Transcript_16237/m.25437 type:complete len:217 (-) Transcript_16237:79-729(-)